uniref:Col_cuticle_N domain-containing protein n=1 Tax=Caenorhabditis tropicalis TaxID=1561998 RepID=A0A1I7TID6_9PELO
MDVTIEIANIVPLFFIAAILVITAAVISWYTINNVIRNITTQIAELTREEPDVEKGKVSDSEDEKSP